MTIPTIFATRLNVAVSRDTAMISFGIPSGPVESGQVTHEEASRVLISHHTLREMAALLTQKVFELDALMAPQAAAISPFAEPERRSIFNDNDEDETGRPRVQ